MKKFYIYLHCRPNGTPFYVGKGCDGVRPRSHDFRRVARNNTHYNNIVAKHGKENILVSVFYCDSEADAFICERIMIKFFGKQSNESGGLVNITDGGEGVSGHRWKWKDRQKSTKRIFTDEHRAALSQAQKAYMVRAGSSLQLGNSYGCHNKGLEKSVETRAKLSISAKIRCLTRIRNERGQFTCPEC